MASAGTSSTESISLNLTPMMDVFSILITFLLMSYSTDPVNVDPRQGLELPSSITTVGLDEIPAVAVTKTEILVNEKKVASVVSGEVPEGERDQGAVRRLYEELVKLKEANDRVTKAQGKEAKLGVLTMEMEKSHPFKLTKRVMLSAQQAEFVTFKLMTKKPMT
jgi:biopolymer transport protein ExbD